MKHIFTTLFSSLLFFTTLIAQNSEQATIFGKITDATTGEPIDFATIYIGGGITKNSDTESEWNETVAKAEIMKQVL